MTPEYEISIKTARYDTIRCPIVYERPCNDIQIDWEKTKDGIIKEMKDAIRTKEQNLMIDLVWKVIEREKDKIEYYVISVSANIVVDYIQEHVVSPDESDISAVSDEAGTKPLNVSNVLKLNKGYWKVKGLIRSISEPFKLIQGYVAECLCGNYIKEDQFEVPKYKEPKPNLFCKSCHGLVNLNYDYINALSVELQDDETFSDIERLNCILLDTDTS
ncbi:MAG: hypothetical protein L0H53_16815, partial [Candidatus Nitrosocosmicus sp.]|nr:hypothetical protein [Candidatus Nitrosocosmicus sp.]